MWTCGNHIQGNSCFKLINNYIHLTPKGFFFEGLYKLIFLVFLCRKMSKISRKLGRHPEVRQLFHGTNETSVKAICQQGFDWRLCGVHGTSFGKGSYFAKNASYSDGYAGNSQQGHKLMFLAKVIVGSYVVGNSNTVRPPPMNPLKPHELHHSCVDNQISPSIFVIFENDQAYPELLITYS